MKPTKYFFAEDTVEKKDIDELIAWLQTYPHLTQGELVLAFMLKPGTKT